jgi:Xaa-Pro dipeptidase
MTFADLHVQMHQQLGQVLADADLVSCSPEQAFEDAVTEDFCPHGLGHLLGLQVHDVGGHLADDKGNSAPPPEQYPNLRFTRAVELDHVFTIEPGLYFIQSLLADAKANKQKRNLINWNVVDALQGYGGIRIEDNVRVLADGVENLTRNAFKNIST